MNEDQVMDEVNRINSELNNDDYPIKTVDAPVSVHIFNRSVIIICRDGSVIQLARR